MSESLRRLVACEACDRQFDIGPHRAGERFHCYCGDLIIVPAERSYESSVVSCGSCGGTRQGNAMSCRYCKADFSLHEQDLQTICPKCFTRISNKSRYCHFCAVAIVSSGELGEPVDLTCPKCGEDRNLAARAIRESEFQALECGRCAGLWLETEVFAVLESAAIEMASSGMDRAFKSLSSTLPRQSLDDQNLYRRCPQCRSMMHRRNYGPGSGIIIDQCQKHGFWFDLRELEVILRWIRTGGLLDSKKRRRAMQKDRDRMAKTLETYEQWRRRFKGSDYSDYQI